MTPEILEAERPKYTAKVDVYSLGVVLADMMTSSYSESNSLLEKTEGEDTSGMWCESYAEMILLSWLTQKNPSERPDTKEILSIVSQVDKVKEMNVIGTGKEVQVKWYFESEVEIIAECEPSRRLLVLRKTHKKADHNYYNIQIYSASWAPMKSIQIKNPEPSTQIVYMFVEDSHIYIICKSVEALIPKFKLVKYSFEGSMLQEEPIMMAETEQTIRVSGSFRTLVFVTNDCFEPHSKLIYILYDDKNAIQTYALSKAEPSKTVESSLLSPYRKIFLWHADVETHYKVVSRDFAVSSNGRVITVDGTSAKFSVNVYNEYGQFEKCIFRYSREVISQHQNVPRICLDVHDRVYFVYGEDLFIFSGEDFSKEQKLSLPASSLSGVRPEEIHLTMIKRNGDIILTTPDALMILSNPTSRGE